MTKDNAVEFEVLDDYGDTLSCNLGKAFGSGASTLWVNLKGDVVMQDDGNESEACVAFAVQYPDKRQRLRDFANALLRMVDEAEARLSGEPRNAGAVVAKESV